MAAEIDKLDSPEEKSKSDESLYSDIELPAAKPAPKKQPVKGAPSRVSKLGNLEPFSEVVIIQKKYLPKTHRFELSPGFGYIINENFFNDSVLYGRLGYGFTESWGVEATYQSVSASQREITQNLNTERNLATASLVTPKSYFGLAAKWSPIFGKIALFNSTIVPYETFFLVGGGSISSHPNGSSTAAHVGAGQMYAIKQWLAFRWDFDLLAYSAKSSISGASESITDVHMNIGFSFFFPGTGYR